MRFYFIVCVAQNEVKREVADRETQLDMSTQQYQALQSKLEHMLATIARETIEIKKLEQELREGMRFRGTLEMFPRMLLCICNIIHRVFHKNTLLTTNKYAIVFKLSLVWPNCDW